MKTEKASQLSDKFLESFTSALEQLSQIGEQILSDKNSQETSESILKTLQYQLKAYGGGIYFIDEKTQALYLYSYTQSLMIEKAVKVLKDSVYNIRFPVKLKGPLITHCIQKNTIVQSPYLKDFYSPQVSAFALDLLQSIVKIRLCVGIPMRFQGKPLGVLFTSFKRPSLQPVEWALLNFYASFSGIAIDNSNKFEKLKKQYALEKEMSAMLAHELKTPIAIAMNNAMLLSDQLEKSPENSDAFEMNKKSEEAIKRLNRICSSVLTLREVEMQNVATIHELRIKDSLLPIIETFEQLTKAKGINFTSKFILKPGKFFGGGVQFEQMLTILLDNALKYTEKGTIDVLIESNGKMLKGTVSNTGYKIDPNKKKFIFEKFYQAHQERNHASGLGLGLYIASTLAEKLEGSIEFRESEEKGNQFIIKIPIYTSRQKN